MQMKTVALTAGMALAAASAWAQAERWLHIKVQEHTGSRARVSVNVPCSLAEAAVALIPDGAGRDGRIRLEHAEIDGEDLRTFLKALRDAREAPYVTFESDDEDVRIWKAGNVLHIRATGRRDKETVEVKLPMAVVEALVSGPEDELDVAAAMRALAQAGEGEVVAVNADGATVRVWVDENPEGK